jgi:hypothetical protein
MNFIIFNLNDGSKKSCNLADLSQFLSPNCEIVRINGDKHEAVGFVSHALLVHFAVESAHYAYQNYSKRQDPRVQNCIDLTKKWVKDQSSVSAVQLRQAAAADTAYYAANAAANTAYAAGKNKQEELIRQGNFILKYFEG